MRTAVIFLALCSVACTAEMPKSSPWVASPSFNFTPTQKQTLTFNDAGGPVLVITPEGVVQHPSGKPLANMPRAEQLRLLCDAMRALSLGYGVTLTRCVDP